MDFKTMMTKSPFHQWLGVELLEENDGVVKVRLPYHDGFSGGAGLNIHGGIIASLADITACFAMMSAIKKDAPNLDLRVDYLRMAPTGATLIATGQAVKAGRTIGVADVEIHTEEGRLVAVGRSSIVTNSPGREALTGGKQS